MIQMSTKAQTEFKVLVDTMTYLRTLKDGTKVYRVYQEIETPYGISTSNYLVYKKPKPKNWRPPIPIHSDPVGSVDEVWDEELKEFNP